MIIRKKVCKELSISKETYENNKYKCEWGIYRLGTYCKVWLCPYKKFKTYEKAKNYLNNINKLRVGKYIILQIKNISEISSKIINEKTAKKKTYALFTNKSIWAIKKPSVEYNGVITACDKKHAKDKLKEKGFYSNDIIFLKENKLPISFWNTYEIKESFLPYSNLIKKIPLRKIQPKKEDLVAEAL